MTTRQYIIALLREEGFFYIEERILCYLETFVTELLVRLIFTIEEIALFLRTWLRSMGRQATRDNDEAVFLRLIESDDEIYFTILTRDARLLCVFSGDSLVETIALAILATPSIPTE
jgi:hypothetical protein